MIKYNKVVTDEELSMIIRNYGIGKFAREAGIDVSYVSHILAGRVAPEHIYTTMRKTADTITSISP